MYPVSNAFHEAVANGNPQKAMLIFPDGVVFTNEDINVQNGIEFHDNFNMEENLSIGQATSNEISFSLFNDARLLNDFPFGDFLATCGVRISTAEYTPGAGEVARCVVGSKVYTAHKTSPYIRANGTGLSSQPGGEVCALFAVYGKLYCYAAGGDGGAVYNLSDDSMEQGAPHAHMTRKAQLCWAGSGRNYDRSTRAYTEWIGGVAYTFEFCPWGWFTAERPKAPDVIQIDMTCYDFMLKFEKDFPGSAVIGVSYPCTIGHLFEKLCQHAGVNFASSTFINSTATITEEPEEFENCTMRDIIKWIAEAAGSNARFNRDGQMEMAWLKSTEQVYGAGNYREFNPYWYQTRRVTKLYNRDTQEATDQVYGTGNEAYLIQDNPLLKGVT